MPNKIEFPKVEPQWLFNRDCVRFFAVVDNSVIHCAISIEALIFNFGARDNSDTEALRTFHEHRAEIELAARSKIEKRAIETGGEVILRSNDFPERSAVSHPMAKTSLVTKVSSAIQDVVLLNRIRAANIILQSDFVRGSMPIQAEWESSVDNLVKLTLRDVETSATADDLFTRSDLSDTQSVRDSLFKLWDDLLSAKGERLSRAFETAIGVGG